MASRVVRDRHDDRWVRLFRGYLSKEHGELLDQGREEEEVAVGIDASLTKFGLSVIGLESGEHTTVLYKPKYSGSRRLWHINEFVTSAVMAITARYNVGEYVMEGYSMASKSRQHAIGEGGGTVKLSLLMLHDAEESLGYPTLVSPNALKKYVTGNGQAEKSLILKRVWQKWGADLDEDNQADAYGLARLGVALLSGATDYQYESEVVASLERNTEWVPPT